MRSRSSGLRVRFAGWKSSASTPRGIRWQGRPVARSSSAHSSGLGANSTLRHGVEPAPQSPRPGLRSSGRWRRIGAWAAGAGTIRRAARRTRARWCANWRQAAGAGGAPSPRPRMPTSLGPVMWIRSGWKRSSTSPISGMWRKNAGSRRRSFSRTKERKLRGSSRVQTLPSSINCLGAVAGAHAEKGKIAPPREGLKVAAGMGDSVHFVEGVGKVRDARHWSGHIGAEFAVSAELAELVQARAVHASSANTR